MKQSFINLYAFKYPQIVKNEMLVKSITKAYLCSNDSSSISPIKIELKLSFILTNTKLLASKLYFVRNIYLITLKHKFQQKKVFFKFYEIGESIVFNST